MYLLWLSWVKDFLHRRREAAIQAAIKKHMDERFVHNTPPTIVGDPLIPWEFFPDNDDPHLINMRQGMEEDWLHAIWVPYCRGLTQEERDSLIWSAPNENWREWVVKCCDPKWFGLGRDSVENFLKAYNLQQRK